MLKFFTFFSACAMFLGSIVCQADSDITIQGVVSSTLCKIDVGSQQQTIPIGTIPASQLSSGAAVTTASFELVLLNCDPDIASVTVVFNGPESSNQPGLIKFSPDNINTALGLQWNGNNLALGQPLSINNLTSGRNTLTFSTYVKADRNANNPVITITPGDVSATINFTITYL